MEYHFWLGNKKPIPHSTSSNILNWSFDISCTPSLYQMMNRNTDTFIVHICSCEVAEPVIKDFVKHGLYGGNCYFIWHCYKIDKKLEKYLDNHCWFAFYKKF